MNLSSTVVFCESVFLTACVCSLVTLRRVSIGCSITVGNSRVSIGDFLRLAVSVLNGRRRGERFDSVIDGGGLVNLPTEGALDATQSHQTHGHYQQTVQYAPHCHLNIEASS